MPSSDSNDSSFSGVSVAFGFVAVGLVFGYWLTDVYGFMTKYVAAGLILLGLTGFFIELSKRLTSESLRFDNLGVGLLLLFPSLYCTYLVNKHSSGLCRGVLVTILGAVVLIGFMAAFDFVESIFESLVDAKDLKGKILGFMKFITILVSSLTTIFVAAQQLLK